LNWHKKKRDIRTGIIVWHRSMKNVYLKSGLPDKDMSQKSIILKKGQSDKGGFND